MLLNRLTQVVAVAALLTLALPASAQRNAGRYAGSGTGNAVCRYLLSSAPEQELDANESAQLIYLREEEKLARDVYTVLHLKWGMPVFQNIAGSEQRHFNALKLLLDRYGLADPAAEASVGIFENQGLSTLYADLVAEGETSLLAALRVGATIEDLDHHDLSEAIAATDNDDLKMVYGNLQLGTQNHMRAFVRLLEAGGESYTAQYIDAATLEDILSMSYYGGPGYGGRRNGPKFTDRGGRSFQRSNNWGSD
jgi:hypothetical protein